MYSIKKLECVPAVEISASSSKTSHLHQKKEQTGVQFYKLTGHLELFKLSFLYDGMVLYCFFCLFVFFFTIWSFWDCNIMINGK